MKVNIFFDLDGTLLDSRKRLYKLFQDLVLESNLTIDEYWELKRNKINHKTILIEKFGYTKISRYDELNIGSDLNSKAPHLFEVNLKTKITYVYPRPSLGRGLDDQEPLLSREEYNSNFLID